MVPPVVILAAHGSHAEPSVNARIAASAHALSDRLMAGSTVLAAFNQGSPRFADVLDRIKADTAVVIPVMTSDGYFARKFLPAELARNRRFSAMRIVITPPVGTHAGIVNLLAERVEVLASEHGLLLNAVTLALVGHGTPRHPSSRSATESAAAALRERAITRQVVTAFIDDDPPIRSVLPRSVGGDLLVIPFLIGAGPHAVEDIPRDLGLDRPSFLLGEPRASAHADAPSSTATASPPGRPARTGMAPAETEAVRQSLCGLVGGRRVICDAPIGSHPGLVDLLEDLARRGGATLEDPPPSDPSLPLGVATPTRRGTIDFRSVSAMITALVGEISGV